MKGAPSPNVHLGRRRAGTAARDGGASGRPAASSAGLLLAGWLALAGCGGDPGPPEAEPRELPGTPVAECSTPAVGITGGEVCGRTGEAFDGRPIRSYLGMPFADTTAGANRWRPPQPSPPWEGTFAAVEYGPPCPQTPLVTGDAEQSEDCLSLNLWTPADATRGPALPVIVFIYGGGFSFGADSFPLYDGTNMAALGDVVVVTFNYRLGALGFLSGVRGLTGNYGFLDQAAALEWVHDNVAAFGGDPAKVTLVGESAGAMSVGLHLTSPRTRHLFRAAVMESNPYGVPYKSLPQSRLFGKLFKDVLGCPLLGLDCMRRKSFDEVVRAQNDPLLVLPALWRGLDAYLTWTPVLDGELLSSQPVAEIIDKPTILGTNRNEGTFFVGLGLHLFKKESLSAFDYRLMVRVLFGGLAGRILERYPPDGDGSGEVLASLFTDYFFTCATRHVARRSAAPTWAYQYTHVASFPVWTMVPQCFPEEQKVCHATELPSVFRNAEIFGLPNIAGGGTAPSFTPGEIELAERTVRYWTNLATHLDPNGAGAGASSELAGPAGGAPLPEWPRFTAEDAVYLDLAETPGLKRDLGAQCAFWDTVGYDLSPVWQRHVDQRLAEEPGLERQLDAEARSEEKGD